MFVLENWKTVVFNRYAQFRGRADRAEYWWYALANGCAQWSLLLLSSRSTAFLVGYAVWAIATFIPSLAVFTRRLHDTGRSGWWWLIAGVPIVGTIVLIVFLASGGTRGANRYGMAPDQSKLHVRNGHQLDRGGDGRWSSPGRGGGGSALPIAANDRAERAQSARFCTQCGAPHHAGGRFCPSCGAPATSAHETQYVTASADPQSSGGRGATPAAVVGSLLLLVWVLVATLATVVFTFSPGSLISEIGWMPTEWQLRYGTTVQRAIAGAQIATAAAVAAGALLVLTQRRVGTWLVVAAAALAVLTVLLLNGDFNYLPRGDIVQLLLKVGVPLIGAALVLVGFLVSRGAVVAEAQSGSTPAASRWAPDPAGRFEARYHDGARWTHHVVHNGVQTIDRHA